MLFESGIDTWCVNALPRAISFLRNRTGKLHHPFWCVNALPRAISFLRNQSKLSRCRIILCQCPASGDFISTQPGRDMIGSSAVSMPCLGRFHFYGYDDSQQLFVKKVSMPCLGRFHFYGEKKWNKKILWCVNALPRAISFLQLFDNDNKKENMVSMPCLGRFHFYNNYFNNKQYLTRCQCPASGDFISTFSDNYN